MAEFNTSILDADDKLMAVVSAVVRRKKGVILPEEGEIESSITVLELTLPNYQRTGRTGLLTLLKS